MDNDTKRTLFLWGSYASGALSVCQLWTAVTEGRKASESRQLGKQVSAAEVLVPTKEVI
jgi:hypothetical protein